MCRPLCASTQGELKLWLMPNPQISQRLNAAWPNTSIWRMPSFSLVTEDVLCSHNLTHMPRTTSLQSPGAVLEE